MASTGLQLVGFVLGVLSWIGMIGTCSSPEWRKNSHGQTLIDSTLRYDGLWVRCKAFPTGLTNCDDYKAFFIGLPVVLQVCRALMISAIGLGFIAILVTVLGIKCTSIGGSHPRTKAKVTMIGGLLFGVAGNLVAISLFYAYQWTVYEHYSLMKAFYIAVATSIAGNASGLTLVAGSCTLTRFTTPEVFGSRKNSRSYSMTGRTPTTVCDRVQYRERSNMGGENNGPIGAGNPVYSGDYV